MVQTLQARNVTLRDLIVQFNLQFVEDDQFFFEWQQGLPELTEFETQFLDKVKVGFFNLVTDPPVLEKPVQLSIVAPLLFLADFYLPPFQVKAECSVEIVDEDEGITIRGSLDVLVLKQQLWLLILEAKQLAFSTEAGLAQLLTYMLASPEQRLGYGLITNGASFLFVKLAQDQPPRHTTSAQFSLRNPGNELYKVLQILKHIGQL